MMKKVVCILLACMTLVMLAACSSATTTTGSETVSEQAAGTTQSSADQSAKDQVQEATGDKPLYVFVSVLDNLEYFYDHRYGLEQAAEYFNVDAEYVSQLGTDTAEQTAQIEQAVAKKANGIILFGTDDSLIPAINEAIDAGVYVVTVDGDVANSRRTAYVGTSNYNAGYQGGLKMAELINEEGEVAILTVPGQSNLEERISGYADALALYPDIEIVAYGDTKNDTVVAVQTAEDIIRSYPNLKAIASVEAGGSVGMQTALKETDTVGKIVAVAMDRSTEVLAGIEEGSITATVVQQTQLMPFYAIQVMENLRLFSLNQTTDNAAAGVSGVPNSIDTGVVIVDSSTYKYFVR